MAKIQHVSHVPLARIEDPCADKAMETSSLSLNNFDDVQTQTPVSSLIEHDHDDGDVHEQNACRHENDEDPLNGVFKWLSHADQEELANWLKPLHKISADIHAVGETLDDASFIDEEDMLSWVDDGQTHQQSQEKSLNEKGTSREGEAISLQSERFGPESHSWQPWFAVPSSSHDESLIRHCRSKSSTVANEDEEWLARQRLTGSVGRLVNYSRSDEVPEEDIYGLRATSAGRIIVTDIWQDGLAAMAGVTVGDELVSINGRRDFAHIPAPSILAGLQPPVSLVFVGFVGKVQAEVRVKHTSQIPCGVPSHAHIMGGASVEFCDAVVFQQSSASLLLATSNRGEAVGQREAMYELQRDEARDILQQALVDVLQTMLR